MRSKLILVTTANTSGSGPFSIGGPFWWLRSFKKWLECAFPPHQIGNSLRRFCHSFCGPVVKSRIWLQSKNIWGACLFWVVDICTLCICNSGQLVCWGFGRAQADFYRGACRLCAWIIGPVVKCGCTEGPFINRCNQLKGRKELWDWWAIW